MNICIQNIFLLGNEQNYLQQPGTHDFSIDKWFTTEVNSHYTLNRGLRDCLGYDFVREQTFILLTTIVRKRQLSLMRRRMQL